MFVSKSTSSSSSSKKKQQEDLDSLQNEGYWLDLIIIFILTIFGCYSRFYNLEHPNEVVFDEQHFGKFINWYIRGEYFLDIHPPLGKLLMMASGLILGYNDNIDFDRISAPYPDHTYMSLRILPALFGTLLIPLIFVCMRLMNIGRGASCLVAWLVLVENIIITESRYILCDSFLFFFATAAFALSIQANNQKILSLSWAIWMVVCGTFMGLTISVKFTGLGLVGTLVVHQFIVLFVNYDREYPVIFKDIFIRFLLLVTPAMIIFFGLFIIHIQLLPFVGDGDAFMSHEFRARLLQIDGTVQPGYEYIEPLGLWDALMELISTMHGVNISLRATHPFQSYWYEWIFIQCKTVLYWQKLRAGYGMWIYCVGNAASWLFSAYFGIIGFFLISLAGVYIKCKQAFNPQFLSNSKPKSLCNCIQNALDKHWWHALLVWIAYLGNYLPYTLIPRAVWNYHYIPALLCSFMLCGIMAQILLEILENYDLIWYNILKCCFVLVIVSVTCCFLYLSPWTYALPLSDALHADRFIFKSWEYTG